ncbi:MAG TPA: hypothetical protein VF941_19210 [Clostridia bacterium]
MTYHLLKHPSHSLVSVVKESSDEYIMMIRNGYESKCSGTKRQMDELYGDYMTTFYLHLKQLQ